MKVNILGLYIATMLGSSGAYAITSWFNPGAVMEMPYAEFAMRMTPPAIAVALIIYCVKEMTERVDDR